MRFKEAVLGGAAAVAALCLLAGCGGRPSTGEDAFVTTKGSIEVTAELVEIRGEFANRADYDYAFIMKYAVLKTHRGEVPPGPIYVGHYNPEKPRDRVKDARVEDIGGTLAAFQAGDVHRMALEVPIDDFFMGGIINRYFGEETGPVHWAVWTNPAARP